VTSSEGPKFHPSKLSPREGRFFKYGSLNFPTVSVFPSVVPMKMNYLIIPGPDFGRRSLTVNVDPPLTNEKISRPQDFELVRAGPPSF